MAFLLAEQAPLFVVSQALLEAPQDLRVSELPLVEPGLRHDAEPFPKRPKALRIVRNYNYSLLNGRARYVRRSVEEQGGIHLPGTRYAEEGGRRLGLCSGAQEREVGKVLGRAELRG